MCIWIRNETKASLREDADTGSDVGGGRRVAVLVLALVQWWWWWGPIKRRRSRGGSPVVVVEVMVVVMVVAVLVAVASWLNGRKSFEKRRRVISCEEVSWVSASRGPLPTHDRPSHEGQRTMVQNNQEY